MRALLPFLAMLLVAGCATSSKMVDGPSDDRIRILFFSSWSAEKGDIRGYEIFFEDPSPFESGDNVVGYAYSRGKNTERCFAGMIESEYFTQALYAIGFQPFDYEAEMKAVDAGIPEKKRKGFASIVTDGGTVRTDGPKIEVTICMPGPSGEKMKFSDPIPRQRIAAYALHSEKFKKLKAVMDLVAQNYGHAKLEL